MDVIQLLTDLVRIPSVNATLGGEGEAELADRLADELARLGGDVTLAAVDGQPAPNLIAVFRGPADGKTLVFESHLDTVPLAEPDPGVRLADGRLYGRGACDTKGSAAPMVAAIARLLDEGLPGTVVFAGAVDEESHMAGSRALVDQLPPVDAVVIGEPTSLRPVRVHNGIVRFAITAHGESAHTSKAFLGRNAIVSAAELVRALEYRLLPLLETRGHELIGPALLTAAVIRGGTAPNVVPDRCEVVFDRRVAPGEDISEVLAEIDAVVEAVAADGHDIVRSEPFISLPAVDTPEDQAVVRAAVEATTEDLGVQTSPGGVPYATDACTLSGGGIPAVVLGPGSIDQAHTADEWVELEEVERAVDVYAGTARRFLAGGP
ncbi:MAG: M20 family metallopeptidase [Nitriliruptorales bacterium]